MAAPLTVGRPVPVFTLPDTEGKPQPLTRFRGRSTALFFFCGCRWCAECARAWAQFQRGGALPPASTTVVVYSLNRNESRRLAREYGLVSAQTTVLADPDLRVTEGLYHAALCPRVFALDTGGILRFTNDHRDDAPQKAPALAIVSRALEALRRTAPARPRSLPGFR